MKLQFEVQPLGQPYRRVVLHKGTKIALRLSNPMFHKVGGYSLPFRIPACPINNGLFGFANRVENAVRHPVEMPFRLKFDGAVLLEGSVIVEEGGIGAYEANLVIDRGDFASMVKNKKMNGLAFGGIRTLADRNAPYTEVLAELSKSVKYPWLGIEHVIFPFYAPRLYWNSKNQPVANNWMWREQVMDFSDQPASHSRVPYFVSLYLDTVLKYVFNEHGYNLTENFFASAELSKLVLFNNRGSYNHELDYSKCVPEVPVLKFLKALEDFFGVTAFFDNKKSEVRILSRQEVLKASGYRDVSRLATKGHKIKHERGEGFVLKQKRPSDGWNKSQLDDFNEVNKWEFGRIGDINVAVFEDLPEAADASQIYQYYVKAEGNIYVVEEDGEDDAGNKTYKWVKHADMQLNLSSGNQDLKIVTEASTLCMHEDKEEIAYPVMHGQTMTGYQIRLMPRTDLKKTDNSIRFLFYRGMALDRRNPDYWTSSTFWNTDAYNNYSDTEKREIREQFAYYPFATNTPYDAYGAQMPGAEHSLSWGGKHGLYEKYYKDYIYWWQNIRKVVNRVIRFSLLDIVNFDFAKKYRIENTDYLVSYIKMEISDNSVDVKDCELYSC